MFDIVVVGGNLAGSVAAINAAKEGANVALIERNKDPYYPAHCGEMLIDTEAELLNLEKIGCKKNEISNLKINVSFKEYSIKLKNRKIIIFDRNFVEKELLNKADKIGIQMMIGTTMIDFKSPNTIYLDNKKIVRGKIIIDASGIACQVGRRIGINTKIKTKDIGVCIQSRVESNFDPNTIKSWFHKPYAPFGYAWLFPLNDKTANIGLGIPGGQSLDFVKLLKNYIKNVTNGEYRVTNTFRDSVPSAPPITTLIKDNVILTGDAARLAHPLSGGGIRNALFSGSLAGIIAAKFINREIPSLTIPETEKLTITEFLAEVEFRISEGASSDIQISAFLAKLTKIGLQTSDKKRKIGD